MAPRRSVLWTLASLMALTAACGGGANQAKTVATGSVTCGALAGMVTFDPPLTLTGTSPETLRVTLTAGDCTTSGSNVPHITSGTVSTAERTGTNSCEALISSKALKLSVDWIPRSVEPSVVSYSGYSPTESAGGGSGLTFPNSGGRAKVSGSFTGSKDGANSTASVFTNEGISELASACTSATGLTSLSISSGGFTIG